MSFKTDLASFQKGVQAALELATSAAVKREIAEDFAEQIRQRTRKGKGVSKAGGPENNLKKLLPSTIAARKRKAKKGDLHPETSPSKSNLTDTGQMLDSLKGRAINDLIELSFSGKRKKSAVTNSEVAVYQEATGRRFFNLSNLDIKRLTNIMSDKLTRAVDRVFKK